MGSLDGEVLGPTRLAMARMVGEVFMVGLVIAVVALRSAFLVPSGQAGDLALAHEPAASSRS